MDKIAGPFGFWTFPILNTLISIFSPPSSKLDSGLIPNSPPVIGSEPTPNSPPVISNEENWSWIDYKGNKREITVHRKVKTE